MTRSKIVIDTNIIVSAALKREGLESHLIELIASHELVLCASAPILYEYREVFGRAKFSALDPQRVAWLLEMLAGETHIVNPLTRVYQCTHDSHNRFLECAETAKADYLVTGNAKHFPKQWKNTKIVNSRELLSSLKL